MEIISLIIAFTGICIGLACSIWILVLAFQESLVWGLCSLLIPFVALVFVIMHWDKAGRPFLYGTGGNVLGFIGLLISGGLVFAA